MGGDSLPGVTALARIISGVVFLLAAMALGLPDRASALEIHQDDIAIVEPGEVVDDDLLIVGATIAMHGHVRGDVIAIGQTVQIAGRVDGDVIALGDSIQISSPIAGNLRALANRLVTVSTIQRNALVAANDLTQVPSGSIVGRLTARAGVVSLGGRVERGATISAERIAIDGHVGGVARLATESLTLGRAATIDRLELRSDAAAIRSPGARVVAEIVEPPRRFPTVERALVIWRNGWRLAIDGALIASLVAATVAGWAYPAAGAHVLDRLGRRPLATAALGLAIIVVFTLTIPLLMLSVVGTAAGVVGGAFAIVGLSAGWLVAALAIGTLADRIGRSATRLPAPLLGLGGASVLWLVGQTPRIGWPVVFVITIALIGALWSRRRPVHYRP